MRILTLFLSLTLTSCSISFQNLDTHGESSDLIDENQTTDPVLKSKFAKKKHKEKDIDDKVEEILV
jgi:hypothetical protein